MSNIFAAATFLNTALRTLLVCLSTGVAFTHFPFTLRNHGPSSLLFAVRFLKDEVLGEGVGELRTLFQASIVGVISSEVELSSAPPLAHGGRLLPPSVS